MVEMNRDLGGVMGFERVKLRRGLKKMEQVEEEAIVVVCILV